jgi:hypothetical protein
MNTKTLMSVSAIIMGVAGIVMSFAPDEILSLVGCADVVSAGKLLVQLAGAMYFGFAMINWTAKANLIGGIYSRPVAIGNFAHFLIGALALSKGYFSLSKAYFGAQTNTILIVTIVYVIFAVLFGLVLFTHPVRKPD